MTAIFFGRKKQGQHEWEAIQGSVHIGIALGLLAALCQALGGVIAKPVMQGSIDPVAASAIRMIAAFIAHCAFRLTGAKLARPIKPINLRVLWICAVNGFLAMAVGMTLILYALRDGNVGMVALLSSTTPIMVLPLLWLYTRKRPNPYAWIGAILAVAGTGILVT
jgi:drug/metabolite transporter (DMT)-like permease